MKRFLPLLAAAIFGAVFAGAAVYVALKADASATTADGKSASCSSCCAGEEK